MFFKLSWNWIFFMVLIIICFYFKHTYYKKIKRGTANNARYSRMRIILAKLKLNTGRRFESFDPSFDPSFCTLCQFQICSLASWTFCWLWGEREQRRLRWNLLLWIGFHNHLFQHWVFPLLVLTFLCLASLWTEFSRSSWFCWDS